LVEAVDLGRTAHRTLVAQFLLRQTDKMKPYCLSEISRRRAHNRIDLCPGYRLCYVAEQYVPTIGYLKDRVMNITDVVLSFGNTERLRMYFDLMTMTIIVNITCPSLMKQDDRYNQNLVCV
jgi:hypothetical protein